MTEQLIAPAKVVRDYLNNSLVWKDFLEKDGFVEGDIVVADPFKAGTTWTQRILQQILSNGEERDTGLSDTSPWLDSSWGHHAGMINLLKEQRAAGKRRVIKSHLPADALPIAQQARYVFVGRNGKDLGISFHNYLAHFSKSTLDEINKIYASWSDDPVPLVIPRDMQQFFGLWLDTNGYRCCDLFDIMASWWKLRDASNVLLVHYTNLNDDLAGQITRIAKFLAIEPNSLRMDAIVKHCSFDYMSGRAEKMAPFGGEHMSSAQAFFHKGPRRDFRTELTDDLIERFDRLAVRKLGIDCARWLETGGDV
jgi:aryl sulfotransferase